MRQHAIWITAFLICTIVSATLPLEAGKQPGSKTPVIVTFRDCEDGFPTSAEFLDLHPGGGCPALTDRIRSDWKQSYIDGEHQVEAFLGTQGNAGNFLLTVDRSPREMMLDFAQADCASTGHCNAPPPRLWSLAGIRVDATAVRKGGVLAMAVNETMAVPGRVTYHLAADEAPGFIDFDPSLRGKSPCKGASHSLSVTRIGESAWEVISSPTTIGCVTLPSSGGSWGGNYHFPFRFTVRIK